MLYIDEGKLGVEAKVMNLSGVDAATLSLQARERRNEVPALVFAQIIKESIEATCFKCCL